MVIETTAPLTKGSTQSRRHTLREKSTTPATKFVARQTHTTITETTTVRTRIVREKRFPKHPSSTVQLIGRDESTYPLANKELPPELREIQWINADMTSGSYEVTDDSEARSVESAPHLDSRRKPQNPSGSCPSARKGHPAGRRHKPALQLTSAAARRITGPEQAAHSCQKTHRVSGSIRNPTLDEQAEEQRYASVLSGSGLVTPGVYPHSRQPTRNASQSTYPVDDIANHMLPTPTLEHERAGLIGNSSTVDGDNIDECSLVASVSDVSDRTISRASRNSAVPTPPIEPADTFLPPFEMAADMLSTRNAALRSSRSPSEPNGTLPSPGPSVATSDADSDEEGVQTEGPYRPRQIHLRGSAEPQRQHKSNHTTVNSAYESPMATDTETSEDEALEMRHVTPNLSRLPSMQAFFDKLPAEMQKYAIHQLLQCCDRAVLHFVANTVNPVLKCDPMKKLPAELGLQVLGYLDVPALCRAAQVSKQWRNLVNSEDKLWKQHFEEGGFRLQDGEPERAIREGWGWQDPGHDGYEEDMSRLVIGSPSPADQDRSDRVPQAGLRRSKRKATSELLGSKQVKRQIVSRESSVGGGVADAVLPSSSQRRLNWAERAELAMPSPALRLPSLQCMHFYKSLYRRHYLIKRNWMKKDPKPHHIAFRAHDNHVVTCLQFDEDKILTGSDDNSINVYDTKTGRLRGHLRGHEGGVWALQYLDNQLVSGGTDRSVRVWDIERGVETQVFRGHTSTVRCLQIVLPVKTGVVNGRDIMTPRHPLIVTGSRDSSLRIWRLPRTSDPAFIQPETDGNPDDMNPYFVRKLDGHQHSVRALAAYGDTLVSGSYDYTVRVWKMSTGETRHQLTGHTAKVYSVVLDVQRNRCVSGSMDYLVKVWDLQTGTALYNLEGHTSLVGLLDLNADRLVSAAADATLRIWDPETGVCKSLLSAHTGAITCFQHDNQKVVSGSERTLKMWDINTGEMKRDLLSDLSGVWQVKFNNRRCVAAVQRDSLTFIEVLDFGAARDGVPARDLGRRIEVGLEGWRVSDEPEEMDL